MRLDPLYRVTFSYPEHWRVDLGGESQHLFLGEGRCEGRVAGRFRGANYARRRHDRTFVPDFKGVIETDDGAVLTFDLRGYGRDRDGERQVVGSVTHLSDHERYRWLNDAVCVLAGEVRRSAGGSETRIVLDVAELIWEPIGE